MSTRQQVIKVRLGMLALPKELQNISAACKKVGISRSRYYEIKEPVQHLLTDNGTGVSWTGTAASL